VLRIVRAVSGPGDAITMIEMPRNAAKFVIKPAGLA
jgi:hypothetical protein